MRLILIVFFLLGWFISFAQPSAQDIRPCRDTNGIVRPNCLIIGGIDGKYRETTVETVIAPGEIIKNYVDRFGTVVFSDTLTFSSTQNEVTRSDSAPSGGSPIEGDIHVDTVLTTLYAYDDGAWELIADIPKYTSAISQPPNTGNEQLGDIHIKPNSGDIWFYQGSGWFPMDSDDVTLLGFTPNKNILNGSEGDIAVDTTTGRVLVREVVNADDWYFISKINPFSLSGSDPIANPDDTHSDFIYNTADSSLWAFDGSVWVKVAENTNFAEHNLTFTGNRNHDMLDRHLSIQGESDIVAEMDYGLKIGPLFSADVKPAAFFTMTNTDASTPYTNHAGKWGLTSSDGGEVTGVGWATTGIILKAGGTEFSPLAALVVSANGDIRIQTDPIPGPDPTGKILVAQDLTGTVEYQDVDDVVKSAVHPIVIPTLTKDVYGRFRIDFLMKQGSSSVDPGECFTFEVYALDQKGNEFLYETITGAISDDETDLTTDFSGPIAGSILSHIVSGTFEDEAHFIFDKAGWAAADYTGAGDDHLGDDAVQLRFEFTVGGTCADNPSSTLYPSYNTDNFVEIDVYEVMSIELQQLSSNLVATGANLVFDSYPLNGAVTVSSPGTGTGAGDTWNVSDIATCSPDTVYNINNQGAPWTITNIIKGGFNYPVSLSIPETVADGVMDNSEFADALKSWNLYQSNQYLETGVGFVQCTSKIGTYIKFASRPNDAISNVTMTASGNRSITSILIKQPNEKF